jgi:hypothetical protein
MLLAPVPSAVGPRPILWTSSSEEVSWNSPKHPRSSARSTLGLRQSRAFLGSPELLGGHYRLADALALLGHRCQSSSDRFTAGESGFLLLIHCRDRPE